MATTRDPKETFTVKEVVARLEEKIDQLLAQQHAMALELAEGAFGRRLDGLTASYGQLEEKHSALELRVEVLEKSDAGAKAVDNYRRWIVGMAIAIVGLVAKLLFG